MAATLDGQFKQLRFYADARKYPSTLSAALDRTEVPEEVYMNLIAAVHENMDKMYRYVSLRKKLLGVEELHMYDIYTPLVENADIKTPLERLGGKSIGETLLTPTKIYVKPVLALLEKVKVTSLIGGKVFEEIYINLEKDKAKIKNHFDPIYGLRGKIGNSAIVVFYDGAFYIPSGEASLLKIQINLKIKEWKGA